MNKLYSFIKWMIYIFEILIVYVIQQNDILLPEIFRGRPVILIPALISIAVFENKFACAAFGGFVGMLMDIGVSNIIGLQMLLMCAVGYLCSWCTSRFIKVNFLVYLLLCILGIFSISTIRFFCFYFINSFGNNVYVFVNGYLISMAYTLIIAPIFYLFNRVIAFFTGGRECA